MKQAASILMQAASLWMLWGSLPQNINNEAAYLKTKADYLKIKKWGSLPQSSAYLKTVRSEKLAKTSRIVQVLDWYVKQSQSQ